MQFIRNLSVQEKVILVIVLMVLIVVAFFFLILKPQLAEVSKLRTEQRTVQQEIQTLKVTLSHLEAAKKEIAALEAEAIQLSVRFPDNFSFASMIFLMQDFFNELGIELTGFTIGSPVQQANYVSVPISFPIITEDYLTILDVLYKLENLPREAKVESISISGSGDTLSLNLSVSFFAMSPESVPKETSTSAAPTETQTQTPEATTTPAATSSGG
ncbi:MAG: type 4a pilus biogenesis protein PilO [Candidatus Subteraquimicrobiales bacterium]|nr:type 4a pilus biogenesis protein PilO [Candidatus Subteraquimicrobiales bacterium]